MLQLLPSLMGSFTFPKGKPAAISIHSQFPSFPTPLLHFGHYISCNIESGFSSETLVSPPDYHSISAPHSHVIHLSLTA
jgi:hypothetical protein